MTNFVCAVCGEIKPKITIFQGTVICMECLNELRNNIVDTEKPLDKAVNQVVEYGMSDIYD